MTASMPVRVMVEDAWDAVTLDLPPATPVEETKRRALTMAQVSRNPDDYLVKYRGAELLDERRTLAESGVVSNAPLIVMARRRRAVR